MKEVALDIIIKGTEAEEIREKIAEKIKEWDFVHAYRVEVELTFWKPDGETQTIER